MLIATSLLFFIWVFRNILFWVSLWQIKEYRLDRMLTHLKETSQGKRLYLSPILWIKILTVLSYIFVVMDAKLLIFFQFSVLLIYIFECLKVMSELSLRRLKRPTFTLKAIGMVTVIFFLIEVLFIYWLVENYLWLLLLDLGTWILVAFFVFALSFPTELLTDVKIEKAIEKRKKVKKLLVIGITGSYGKSSTKEYVAQILSESFSVLKTKGTNNTPIGIANTILYSHLEKYDIFVAEMGAYKKGEIAVLCQIAQPKIGILTGLNDQHLSLFGSLGNTMEAKYELIDALPKDGLALFNGSNSLVTSVYEQPPKMYGKLKSKKVLYSVINDEKKPDIWATDISMEKDGVAFTTHTGEKHIQVRAPLIGAHAVENILPGIFIASHLGMKDKDIQHAVSKLSPLPHTMVRTVLPNGLTVIDDTYNSNPSSVESILSYLRLYHKKKILVLQPMIELGKNASDEHFEIGKKIAHVCDYLFLTNKNFFSSIIEGIKAEKGLCVTQVVPPSEITKFVSEKTKKGDVIALEGREAGASLHKIIQL